MKEFKLNLFPSRANTIKTLYIVTRSSKSVNVSVIKKLFMVTGSSKSEARPPSTKNK